MNQEVQVKCPLCSQPLYRTAMIDERGVLGLANDSPDIQNDKNGYFMICSHCHGEIRLEVVSSIAGLAFQIKGI